MMVREDIIERGPGGLYRVFARKQRPIAHHGVIQKPFVRQFPSKMLFD